jgi:carnitine-CoA ligase
MARITNGACALGTSESIFSSLRDRADRHPDAPFLRYDSDDGTLTLSYAETLGAAVAAADVLADHGIGRGDRVHLDLTNCPEFIVALFACARLGAAIVPTNPAATSDELAFLIGHARPRLTITDADRVDPLERAWSASGAGASAPLLLPDAIPLTSSRDDAGDIARGGDELLAILYTSGTTSRPKGVCVTHANYLHVGRVVAQHLEMRSDDRWLVVLPLFHANAQYYCFMSALHSGASVALMSRFSASRWAAQAREHGATLASLFAAPIRMILAQEPGPDDADNALRTVIFAQRVDDGQAEAFERRFGAGLLQLYGMTETIAPPLMNPLHGPRRNATVGRPVGDVELRLRAPDGTLTDVGELEVRGIPGTTVMAGYLDDPAASATTLADGWLRTGDVLRREPDGCYAFHDRVKDMIKSSGENIAAAELERVIDAHPAVFESAVIGIPDAIRDEVPKAFVVLRTGAAATPGDLLAWCGERMVKFKVPATIELVDELPRTAVGKVQKHLLREQTPQS